MAKPSEHWQGFASIDTDSDKYRRIKQLLSSANFQHLKTRALESRRRHEPDLSLQVECDVDLTHFTSGFDNVILELSFSDDVYWIARIPHRAFDDGYRISMLSEIATMKIILQHTTIPVPRVFDFDASVGQPFGYPYVLMECLGGRALPNGVARSIPHQHYAKVAKQLANVFAELQNLTFSRIGRLWCGEDGNQPVEITTMAWHASPGPLETSLEYFYYQRQSENQEILAMHPDDSDWLTACWVLTTSLAHVIIEDRVRGPFPLCHLDLHFGNMLFDDDYNLTGIIDWSNAQAAPLEQLSVCPELATFPGLSEEDNRPMVELKRLVVESIIDMEKQQAKRPPLDIRSIDADVGLPPNLTSLSTYMGSTGAEVTYRQYMASPRAGLGAGKIIAKFLYGTVISWEQLREVYGTVRFSFSPDRPPPTS